MWNKKLKRIPAAVLAGILLLLSFSCAWAEDTGRQTIKVAFPTQEGMSFFGHSGKVTGYNYDYLEKISEYTGWVMDYVPYGSDDGNEAVGSALQDLQSGKVDLMGPLLKNAATEKLFEFPENSYGTVYTTLNALSTGSLRESSLHSVEKLRVGRWETAATRNSEVMTFLESENISYEIVTYATAAAQQQALIDGNVDVIPSVSLSPVNNARIVAQFAPRPYYFAATKGNTELVKKLDETIERIDQADPNLQDTLYNKYYGAVEDNRTLTQEEQALLHRLQESGEPIRAVMDPDADPYSWYEDGEAHGIAADIFKAVAQKLYLPYEIVPVSTKEEYESLISSGAVDIWMDMDSCYESEGVTGYKATEPYLTTTTSVLRGRGASDRIENLVTNDDHIVMREIVSAVWPNARLTVVDTAEQCKDMVLSGKADGALLMSYVAQRLSRDDLQNRLRVDIVPGGTMELMMGVNANDDVHFLGLWEKTLAEVSGEVSAEIVQEYLEQTTTPNMAQYLFDHPTFLIILCVAVILLLSLTLLYTQQRKGKKQEKISMQLAAALQKAEDATAAKQNFFSKMSHDIRTPLNVVLGMTQIAQKYKSDPNKLGDALNNVTKEGNYLLMLINSILDVNQLEHGTVELAREAFDPAACLQESVEMLHTLSEKKDQQLTVTCDCADRVVVGDANRLKQILINIISNAIKYTHVGGHIDLHLEALPQDRYRFSCADDGIGMSEDFIQHICEDYTRAEDSRVSKIQGTGLGMSVVKGFTDVMGGVTATKLIRQSSRPDRDIPIFAMTANTFASDRRSCREAGMTGYIPKPVSVKSIEDALTEIEE